MATLEAKDVCNTKFHHVLTSGTEIDFYDFKGKLEKMSASKEVITDQTQK